MNQPSPFTLDHLFARAVPDGECLIWTASQDANGYGSVKFSGRVWRAHVAVYTLVHGPVPDGYFVCHTCDVPACIQPSHLVAEPPLWNVIDSMVKGRHTTSKLTEEIVRAIRADNRPAVDVARDYDVSDVTVHHVRSRKTWKWLD